jgi:UDP-glucose/GDP-mannose dehydrogenase family, NAD binding domain
MPEQNIWEESSGLAVMSLHKRIHSQSAEVGIMGLGYVGLTEAIEFARSGFRVTGFDVDVNRIKHIQVGRSYLIDSAEQELGIAVESRKLRATNDFALLKEMDAVLIAVPTPLSKTKTPDLSLHCWRCRSDSPTLAGGAANYLGEHYLSRYHNRSRPPSAEPARAKPKRLDDSTDWSELQTRCQ